MSIDTELLFLKVLALESFMMEVCGKLECKPSYENPSPKTGNKHVIDKIDELLAKAQKVSLKEAT